MDEEEDEATNPDRDTEPGFTFSPAFLTADECRDDIEISIEIEDAVEWSGFQFDAGEDTES